MKKHCEYYRKRAEEELADANKLRDLAAKSSLMGAGGIIVSIGLSIFIPFFLILRVVSIGAMYNASVLRKQEEQVLGSYRKNLDSYNKCMYGNS